MYYYLYKTTNKINDKFYYGVHKHTSLFDKKYFGSGTAINRAVLKHGIDNFSTEVVSYYSTIEEAYSAERILVTDDLIMDKNCYNMVRGGKGGGVTKPFLSEKSLESMRRPKSQEQKDKISKTLMGKCYITDAGKQKISESLKGNQRAKGMTYTHTTDAKEKIAESRRGKKFSDESIEKLKNNRKGKGTGERNAMSDARNREKVRLTKLGLKVMYNSEGIRKASHPGSERSIKLLSEGYSYK